jgi:hypothetical protein
MRAARPWPGCPLAENGVAVSTVWRVPSSGMHWCSSMNSDQPTGPVQHSAWTECDLTQFHLDCLCRSHTLQDIIKDPDVEIAPHIRQLQEVSLGLCQTASYSCSHTAAFNTSPMSVAAQTNQAHASCVAAWKRKLCHNNLSLQQSRGLQCMTCPAHGISDDDP